MSIGLNRIKTQVLVDVADYLQTEVDACNEGIKPEDRPAFEALIGIVERELWKRKSYRAAWRAAQKETKR